MDGPTSWRDKTTIYLHITTLGNEQGLGCRNVLTSNTPVNTTIGKELQGLGGRKLLSSNTPVNTTIGEELQGLGCRNILSSVTQLGIGRVMQVCVGSRLLKNSQWLSPVTITKSPVPARPS